MSWPNEDGGSIMTFRLSTICYFIAWRWDIFTHLGARSAQ